MLTRLSQEANLSIETLKSLLRTQAKHPANQGQIDALRIVVRLRRKQLVGLPLPTGRS